MYPPKMASNAAFAGFEMGVPVVAAVALFVQAVALSSVNNSAGWRALVSRRHRAVRDVHAWAYRTADFVLQPVGRDQVRQLRDDLVHKMMECMNTGPLPRTRAILESMANSEPDDDIEC